ncbi:MAG TPA: DUF1566 domain-containing protein, partial [bacterium]|nr:DUF1566 domain-containing protein [bacterium]
TQVDSPKVYNKNQSKEYVLAPKQKNYSWSKKASNTVNWSEAQQYCESLEEDGYSDWRLPTISELRMLIQSCPATEKGGMCKVADGCANYGKCWSNNCEGCTGSSDGRYSKLGDVDWLWSFSDLLDNGNNKWYVLFNDAGIYNIGKDKKGGVRCFRN